MNVCLQVINCFSLYIIFNVPNVDEILMLVDIAGSESIDADE